MASIRCPLNISLNSHFVDEDQIMNIAHVKEIEKHTSHRACPHPPREDLVLRGSLKDTTPLVLACQKGHFDYVKHIIEVWGTDVNSAGNYYYCYKGIIEGATPLFVAAHQGHINIVQYLISKGSDVSSITSTKSHPYAGFTPLHGALMRSSFKESLSNQSVIVRLIVYCWRLGPTHLLKLRVETQYGCSPSVMLMLLKHLFSTAST